MHKYTQKIIGPLIITILFCIYFLTIAFVLTSDNSLTSFVKWLMVLVPLSLAAVNIYVLIERIKEIRSGEEDDLSQY